MQYRKNKTGEPLSLLGFGCMRFTRKGSGIDLDKAQQEIQAAVEGGVNYFDTAYVYPGSEAAVGEIFHRLGCREKINIATKLPHYLIKSVDGAEKMFRETGCDGVMVARAAQGNPWVFREIISWLKDGSVPERPSPQEVYDTVIRHADLQLQYKGEYIGIREMRKHVSWYTTGYPGSAKFRGQINYMEDMESLKKACHDIFLKEHEPEMPEMRI